ncbi:NAD(P)H-binding protein [Escherichia coli]
MNIVITGGTGLIGRHLIPRLLELGHQITVMTRNPQKASSVLGPRVTLWQGLADQSNLNGVDAVINLVPENRLLINAGLTSKKSVSAKAAGISRKNWSI